eukprot:scaffold38040_cov61-Phaeocystis_antarctica.AAC.4
MRTATNRGVHSSIRGLPLRPRCVRYPPRLPQDAVDNAVSRESAVSHARPRARAPSENAN